MFYCIFIAAILLYTKYMRLDDKMGRELYKPLITIFWGFLLIFSLQYDVGTDYYSYLAAATADELGQFKLNQFLTDKEYLFAGIVYLCQLSGIPQLIFLMTALVQVTPFCIALYQLRKENISLQNTLFMYFALSLSFFNQFNGVRQFAAVNLVFLAVILLLINIKSVLPYLLLLMAPFFHHAAWFVVIPVSVWTLLQHCLKLKLPKKKWVFIGVAVCALIYLIDFNSFITFIISKTELFRGFKSYIESSYVEKMGCIEIATKVIKLLVVFYSIWRLDTERLSEFESKLLLLSYIAVCVMVLSFSSSLIWRVYLFCDLFLIFPTVFFYKYNATVKERMAINLYLSVFLIVKILVKPRGEYLYSSVLFK